MNDQVLMKKELDRNFQIAAAAVAKFGSVNEIESRFAELPRGLIQSALDRRPVSVGILLWLKRKI